MAENAVKYVASAVTAELTSRVFSALARRYGEDAATREKLRRLEMLLIKIHSAIEVSEKRTIENSSLRQWRGKLKDAAAEGDEVLTSFLPGRAADGQASNGEKQEGEAVSSSSAPAPAADVSVTGNSLSDMVQGICNLRNVFFSKDMERLNRTLGSLEKLSPDISDFITLLHVEALPRKVAPPDTTALVPTGAMETTTGETRKRRMMKRSGTDPKKLRGFVCYERPRLVQDRLEQALGVICKAVELADNHHELEDLEWLAYWAANLREAERQGRDVLHAWRTQDNDEKRAVGGCDEEKDDEIGTLVHWQEGLARDVVYFTRLVHLIPARVTLVECGVLPVCS